jgi:hypothetical protein
MKSVMKFLAMALLTLSIVSCMPAHSQTTNKATTTQVATAPATTTVAVVTPTTVSARQDTVKIPPPPPVDPTGFLGLGKEWFLWLIPVLIAIIRQLWATADENAWFTWITKLISFIIPNMKKNTDGTLTTHQDTIWQMIWNAFKKK